MKHITFIFAIIFSSLILAMSTLAAQASGQFQTYATPTPGADGQIIFIVQEGQNCSIIRDLTGVSISQLKSLNRLDDACTLNVGQKLLIGMGDPSGVTLTPTVESATPTPVLPSPTPSDPDASVCISLYNDLNGDALHQDTEGSIADGAISVSGTSGQYSQTNNTTSSTDPVCFEKIIQGIYNISVAAPVGYNPTTQQNYTLEIKSGEQIYVDFGAQLAGNAKPQESNTPAGSNNLLGVVGAVLVFAALGLGIYAWLIYGRKSSLGLQKPPKY